MKTKRIARTFSILFALGSLQPLVAGPEPTEIVTFKDENTGLTVLRAKVSLPLPGFWMPSTREGVAEPGLSEIYLAASQAAAEALEGRRMARHKELEEIAQGAWPLNHLGWVLSEYPAKHHGKAPKSIDDLGTKLTDDGRKQLAEKFHIMDDLAIDPKLPMDKARVIAFETAPPADDGKHWVLLSNGMTERRAIAPELSNLQGVKIQARHKASADSSFADYAILARVLGQKPAKIELQNHLTGKTLEISLDPSKAAPGDRKVLTEWAQQRMWSLPLAGEGTASAILPHWYSQAADLYGCDPASLVVDHRSQWQRQRQGRSTDIFNVFGGRAAITETLQMQDIDTPPAPAAKPDKKKRAAQPATVPIAEIKGVEVKSHPFDEMLGDQPGGRIALADVIPADHLFAYFPKPAGLISWLDGGAEFLFNAGSSATGRSLQYGLSDRYLAALGMNREWMKRLLDSGAIEEIAIAMPDLFLIDGTDITAVARLKNPTIAATLLQLLGIGNLDHPVARKDARGATSHWVRRGDLLVVSTSAAELDRVVKLQADAGKGSLGRSAELRYMLTKLPIKDSTRAFVYLSDPFIRHLVGPETKIAQHRRINARAEMEALVAGSLLYQLDGRDNPTAKDLIDTHYVPVPLIATDAALDPESGAVSATFGPLPRMNPLSALNITTASAREADAYRQYLANYNTFWRRFFDPIALRIDQPDPATYELSVFILPLIDNSIYNGIRNIVASGQSAPPLQIPVIEPEPVAMLSMNLNDETWIKIGGDMLGEFTRRIGFDTAILDSLGPDIHLTLADTDPILEMGSGELANAFGPVSRENEMIMIPALVSMLTRPTALCVGLTDPAAVRSGLDNSVGIKSDIAGSDVTGSLYKIADRQGWIYRINFFDMMTLRLGIEVQDRFLVIRNMPLTTPFKVTGMKPASQPDAQFTLSPRACRLQLPALFASAAERERAAALGGISDLQPLLMTGSRTVPDAAAKLKSWFGFQPAHPAGGTWNWDGRQLSSSRYGTLYKPTQPDYQNGSRDFGLLRKVEAAEIGMRFEQDGLRTTARWSLRLR